MFADIEAVIVFLLAVLFMFEMAITWNESPGSYTSKKRKDDDETSDLLSTACTVIIILPLIYLFFV